MSHTWKFGETNFTSLIDQMQENQLPDVIIIPCDNHLHNNAEKNSPIRVSHIWKFCKTNFIAFIVQMLENHFPCIFIKSYGNH